MCRSDGPYACRPNVTQRAGVHVDRDETNSGDAALIRATPRPPGVVTAMTSYAAASGNVIHHPFTPPAVSPRMKFR